MTQATRCELWIGWRQRYEEEPAAELAIAQLEKLQPTELGYYEVPCGARREALFSRSERRGVVRWTLDFIRFDGEIPEDRTVYHYMRCAQSAIYWVAALGNSREAKAARRKALCLDEEDAKSKQLDLFAEA